MADDITIKVLLTHVQGIKHDLQSQIDTLNKKVDGGFAEMRSGFLEMRTGFAEMRRGFTEAAQHRQSLQEDLYETMRVQHRHGKKLARLGRTSGGR